MPEPTAPESHEDLLERPLFAHIATVRPDGAPQNNVTWYVWDGRRIKLTHTKTRQKYRNFEYEPRVALSIADPDDPYRFIEVRGEVVSIEDDDEKASFYRLLQERYDRHIEIRDADVRVIVTIRPTRFVVGGGGTVRRRG